MVGLPINLYLMVTIKSMGNKYNIDDIMPRWMKPTPMKDPSGYTTPEQSKSLIEATENKRDELLLSTLAFSGRRVSLNPLKLSINIYSIKASSINFLTRLLKIVFLSNNTFRFLQSLFDM